MVGVLPLLRRSVLPHVSLKNDQTDPTLREKQNTGKTNSLFTQHNIKVVIDSLYLLMSPDPRRDSTLLHCGIPVPEIHRESRVTGILENTCPTCISTHSLSFTILEERLFNLET